MGGRFTLCRVAAVAAALAFAAALIGFAAIRDRQTLWQITRACSTDARSTGSPFPCLRVHEPVAGDGGYVIFRPPILDDTVLVPTRKIVGVEDPYLASAGAPNFFADAWRARSVVKGADGAPPARDRLLLVVNSSAVRTQDQLHIHIGCLKPLVYRKIAAVGPDLPVGAWRAIPMLAPHQPFWVYRLGRPDLAGVDPFRLAFEEFGGVVARPADLTIAVAGATIDGKDDLLVLVSYAHAPGSWWPVGADDLLDSRCRPAPLPEAEGSGVRAGAVTAARR